MKANKPDAWKLYSEAFRVLWPRAEKVSDTVSPAALQEMVDRLLSPPEARTTPEQHFGERLEEAKKLLRTAQIKCPDVVFQLAVHNFLGDSQGAPQREQEPK